MPSCRLARPTQQPKCLDICNLDTRAFHAALDVADRVELSVWKDKATERDRSFRAVAQTGSNKARKPEFSAHVKRERTLRLFAREHHATRFLA